MASDPRRKSPAVGKFIARLLCQEYLLEEGLIYLAGKRTAIFNFWHLEMMEKVDQLASDVYYQLRHRIDGCGAGFTTTTSGIEIRILQKLFTEEEARLYLNLRETLETPEVIARRVNEEPKKVINTLMRMKAKGLVIPGRKGESRYFAAAPFALGIAEHQVNLMDHELAGLFEQYFSGGFVPKGPAPLRPIPVNRAISATQTISPYDDIKAIIERHDKIAVAKCFCAAQKSLIGGSCKQPLEVCIFLDFYAEYYVDNGWARWVSKKETMEILSYCEIYGLVCQPVNLKNPGIICNCCKECCLSLRWLKMLHRPAEVVTSNYYAEVNSSLCTGCETCLGRCPMSSLAIASNGTVTLERDRCIGCGLCVVACPSKALTLQKKSKEEAKEPPDRILFMRPPEEFERDMS